MTAGISVYFTYTIATFGLARANGVETLAGVGGALIAFGAWLVTMLVVLGVNDWLAKRYPVTPEQQGTDDAASVPRG